MVVDGASAMVANGARIVDVSTGEVGDDVVVDDGVDVVKGAVIFNCTRIIEYTVVVDV